VIRLTSDIIITETGTSSFGLTNVALPSQSSYVAQILWGAIGWSVGACLGCALAAKETGEERRTALFVGDGSLQLVSRPVIR
jgi:pyruvate decarboxylase